MARRGLERDHEAAALSGLREGLAFEYILFVADYKPTLRTYSKIVDVAKDFECEFEHWRSDKVNVTFYDHGRREQLTISNKKVTFACVNPTAMEESTKRLSNIVRRILQGMKPESIIRFGLRRYSFVDTGLSQDELVALYDEKTVPGDERFRALTATHYDDLAIVLDYTRDDLKVHLRSGPMPRNQAENTIENCLEDVSLYFVSPDRDVGYRDALEALPDASLYVDLDVYRDEVGADYLATFVDSALSVCVDTAIGLKSYLLETRDASTNSKASV